MKRKGHKIEKALSERISLPFFMSVWLAVGYLANLMPKSLSIGLKATNIHL